MRRLLPLLPLIAALPLHAETLSSEIGQKGLAAVETRLEALTAPTDEERFTLGGVQFLRAVEISLQDRWRQGLTDNTGMLPFLRLPIPENPAPEPFTPETIVGIFQKAEAELVKSKTNLAQIPKTSDFGANIDAADLWFDVNANGTRDVMEGLTETLSSTLDMGGEAAAGQPASLMIRFDAADAAWLAAYADLLAAFCDVVRAYDPTEPITRALTARADMAKLGTLTPDLFMGDTRVPDTIDVIAIFLATLNQTPDSGLMAEAQQHLLAMTVENRAFWTRVATETDNQNEWLPNAKQQSVLGVTVTPEMETSWQAVLAEMEAVVKGDKLVPYWRVGAPAGINLGKMFTEPRPIDVAGWVQGWAALPYLEKGTIADSATLDAFDQAAMGDGMLFALYFN